MGRRRRPASRAADPPGPGAQATPSPRQNGRVEPFPEGHVAIADVLSHIASQPSVWTRVAACKISGSDDWQQVAMELTTGIAPPGWKNQDLVYPNAVLLASRRRGSVVAGWLRRRQVRAAGHTVRLPTLQEAVQVRRHASGAAGQFEPLSWPTVVADLCSGPLAQSHPSDILAADDYPTFFNLHAAASYFFWLDRTPVGGTVHRGITYRHQDMSARITRIVFGLHLVHVELDGDGLAGATLEVAGDVPGPTKRLTGRSPQSADFDFSEGLPPQAWVVLRRGSTWLDRRFLKWPYAGGLEPGVEEESVEVDPASMLDYFLDRREDAQVEFKRDLPGGTDAHARTVMKTVSAFANGDGGTLLFGISDEYEAVGVPMQTIDDEKDRISDLIDAWVSPSPTWTFEIYPLMGAPDRVVLALQVGIGNEPPYATGTLNTPSQYYVRHAARSVPARPGELRGLARSRPSAEAAQALFGRQ
jgi:hypothetical protein